MTNVPGPGFLAVLAAVVAAGLMVAAGAVAVVAHALTDRPFWQSIGGAYLGAGLLAAAALVSQWGLASTGLGILAMGVVGYLVAGVLFYAVPVGPGTVLVRVLFDGVGWDEAAYYATIGWVAGTLAGLTAILTLGPRLSVGLGVGPVLGVLGVVAGGPLAAKLLYADETRGTGEDRAHDRP